MASLDVLRPDSLSQLKAHSTIWFMFGSALYLSHDRPMNMCRMHMRCMFVLLPVRALSFSVLKAYERSLPVLSGQLEDDGLVNLVVGGSGNNEGRDRE